GACRGRRRQGRSQQKDREEHETTRKMGITKDSHWQDLRRSRLAQIFERVGKFLWGGSEVSILPHFPRRQYRVSRHPKCYRTGASSRRKAERKAGRVRLAGFGERSILHDLEGDSELRHWVSSQIRRGQVERRGEGFLVTLFDGFLDRSGRDDLAVLDHIEARLDQPIMVVVRIVDHCSHADLELSIRGLGD